ncbi:MAG: DUF1614 domain-containing protein [Methermicoccaceae archaeon]
MNRRLFVYSPISLSLLIFLVILLLPILALVFIGVVGVSLTNLGLSHIQAMTVLIACLVGSFINIPIMQRKVRVEAFQQSFSIFGLFRYPIIRVEKQVLCINVGGCIIPLMVVAYLLPTVPLYPFVLVLVGVTVICYWFSTPVHGLGIVMPAFVPPVVSALLALLLSPENPAGVAFCAGVLGTLLGADILHLRKMLTLGPGVLSIGGAGVFDGIFLTGVLASLLS